MMITFANKSRWVVVSVASLLASSFIVYAGVLAAAGSHSQGQVDEVLEEEFAAADSAIAASVTASQSSLQSSITLTIAGSVDIRGGAPYSGELICEVQRRPYEASGVTSYFAGLADSSGDFSLSGTIHGIDPGEGLGIRLHTSHAFVVPSVSIDETAVLRAERAATVSLQTGPGQFAVRLGRVRLLPPPPLVTITVHGSPTAVHSLVVQPRINLPGSEVDDFEIELPGQQLSKVYSWFPAEDWNVSGHVDGVVARSKSFRRGDHVDVEALVDVEVTGLVDTLVVPPGSEIVFFSSLNYRTPTECGVVTLADLNYRLHVENAGWQASAYVQPNGAVGPLDLIPAQYVVEAWPAITSTDDFTAAAPAPLAVQYLSVGEFGVQFTLP